MLDAHGHQAGRLALEDLEQIGLPAIIRPAFTMGGTGGGVVYNLEDFEDAVGRGLDLSPPELQSLGTLEYAIVRKDKLAYVYDFRG